MATELSVDLHSRFEEVYNQRHGTQSRSYDFADQGRVIFFHQGKGGVYRALKATTRYAVSIAVFRVYAFNIDVYVRVVEKLIQDLMGALPAVVDGARAFSLRLDWSDPSASYKDQEYRLTATEYEVLEEASQVTLFSESIREMLDRMMKRQATEDYTRILEALRGYTPGLVRKGGAHITDLPKYTYARPCVLCGDVLWSHYAGEHQPPCFICPGCALRQNKADILSAIRSSSPSYELSREQAYRGCSSPNRTARMKKAAKRAEERSNRLRTAGGVWSFNPDGSIRTQRNGKT